MRDLKDFTGRALSSFSGRSIQDFSGRTLSDDNDEFRVSRAVGNQEFPWSFPLWFSDIEPRAIADYS